MTANRFFRAVIVFGLAGTVGPLCHALFWNGGDLLRDVLLGIWPAWVLAMGLESQVEAAVVTFCCNVLVFALIGAAFGLARTVALRACVTGVLLVGGGFWLDFLSSGPASYLAASVFFPAVIAVLSLWDHGASKGSSA